MTLISGGQITVDSKLNLAIVTESLVLTGVEDELTIRGAVTLGGSEVSRMLITQNPDVDCMRFESVTVGGSSVADAGQWGQLCCKGIRGESGGGGPSGSGGRGCGD